MKKSRVRIAVSAAALAAVAIGATGCATINQQATTLHYDASDGVSAGDRAELVANNLLLVTNGDGEPARFLGHLANDSSKAQKFEIDFDGQTVSTVVPAKDDVSLQDEKFAKPFTIDASDKGENKTTNPGLQISVTVTTGKTVTDNLKIPVVDGTIKDYAEYVPGGSKADVRDHLKPSPESNSEEH